MKQRPIVRYFGGNSLKHLSLFSGIGGDSLAARAAGFTTIQFVEINPFCQANLSKNFPGVPIHADVTTFDGTRLRGRIAVLSAGSPCQGFSEAGMRQGLADDRSALITHTIRITDECRPSFVVIENTPGIVRHAGQWVESRFAEIGYTSLAWVTIPAYPFGAWFSGERTFHISAPDDWCTTVRGDWQLSADDEAHGCRSDNGLGAAQLDAGKRRPLESRPIGVADDVPYRVDRVRALGNAVCPDQAQPIFEAIAKQIG
jgi:DNA (cytosine-5)-methyltransferase 1